MPNLEPIRNNPAEPLPDQLMKWIEVLRLTLRPVPDFIYGEGSPEGVVSASLGARYFDRLAVSSGAWAQAWSVAWGTSWGSGSGGSILYFKTTDGANLGWIPYA